MVDYKGSVSCKVGVDYKESMGGRKQVDFTRWVEYRKHHGIHVSAWWKFRVRLQIGEKIV